MLTSLAFIFLVGLAAAAICQQLKLPRIIGMLITGIILGHMFLTCLILLFCPFHPSYGKWL